MIKHLQLMATAVILASALLAGCAQNQVEIDQGKRVTEASPAPLATDTLEGAARPTSKVSNIATPEIADEPVTLPPEMTALPTILAGLRDHKMVVLAGEDLAEYLGISAEAIQLKRIEHVIWPDASLGCPQPNMMYAQVLTPGYRIVLQAEAREYNYHTDETGTVIRCEISPGLLPDLPVIPVTPGEIDDGIPWMPVD